MPKPPVFRPIKGSARRYIGPGGREYSRRQRDNYLLKLETGFENRSQLERVRVQVKREQPGWLKRVYKHTGRAPTWSDYANWRDVKRIRDRLAVEYGEPDTPWGNDRHSPELTAADGPLADYLDVAGLRAKNGKPVGGS